MNPLSHPSPNFSKRRGGATPDIVVLHYTAMCDASQALARLCDPDHEVSAHYLIGRDGQIHSLVHEEQRAWHAGAGAWGACDDVNSHSIGIELDNDGFSPFTARLMDALAALLREVSTRWAVRPERVIAHSDMAPMRKADPGPRFDWRRLAVEGLSVWPDTAGPLPVDNRAFRADLAQFGYPMVGDSDLLNAFRLRFRPGHSGALDGVDMALAAALSRRYPVDVNALNT